MITVEIAKQPIAVVDKEMADAEVWLYGPNFKYDRVYLEQNYGGSAWPRGGALVLRPSTPDERIAFERSLAEGAAPGDDRESWVGC